MRQYIGSYLAVLGGADAIVMTGGIGQHAATLRGRMLAGFEYAGIVLDAKRNHDARGEIRIEAAASRTALWIVPTNEELIVARQTVAVLAAA